MSEDHLIVVNSVMKIEQLVKIIQTCSARQVILQITPDCQLLAGEINLRLIKFYAEEEEKDIIINAVDPEVIALAQRLGISTIHERDLQVDGEQYAASDAVDAETLREPTREISSPQSMPRRISRHHGGLFSALLVAFFSFTLAVWWFLQPQATVIVYPKEQNLTFRSRVLTNLDYADRDVADGKIPAKLFEKDCILEVQTTATGFKTIGVNPATGKITLINSTGQAIRVPKGTVFSSKNGIRFLSEREVIVPRKVTKYQYGVATGEEYGRVETTITAEIKGTSGNLGPQSINKIEDERLQRMLSVVNLSPMTRGTDRRITVVSLEDVKKGEAEARNQMRIAGPEEAAALVGQGYLFLPELTQLELIGINYLPQIGETSDVVRTKLEYRVTTIAPSKSAIQKYLASWMSKNLPENFEAKNNEIVLVSATAKMNSDRVDLELEARGRIRGILNQGKIKNLLKGKTTAEAEKLLIGLEEVANFKLETERAVFPAFGFQIRVLFPAGGKEPVRP